MKSEILSKDSARAKALLSVASFAMLTLPLAIATLTPHWCYSDSRSDLIGRKLKQFAQDPAAFMARTPEKSTFSGPIATTPEISPDVSKYDLINVQMARLGAGEDFRATLTLPAERPLPIDHIDRAEDLVDELRLKTLASIEEGHLLSARLDEQPWSDTYWPIARGSLAWRYNDPAFPKTLNWKTNSDYLRNPQNLCSVEQLSPAEKYDLLVGDTRNTLKNAMIEQGQSYFSTYGSVASWMGICHGWAAAAYMAARPTKKLELIGQDGHTKIPFFPADVKALTSLLWANGAFKNRFIGRRCYNKNPARDPNGRITELACYGENPATWHLSVVNQIGVSRRSFVMDALHDTEIWNQPIYSYSYSYFNPLTGNPVSNLNDAIVPFAEFTGDKFKKYRADRTNEIVGIAMDVTYVAETSPTSALTNSPNDDSLVTVQYLYDLELGPRREIIGGEWYSDSHPGFLWTPARNAHAQSVGDTQLAQAGISIHWNAAGPIPTEWAGAIQYSSENGQPLAEITETLGILAALQ